ncbi:putative RNA binding protein YcfA (HicA-like mRNA interferase family) [Desulfomicrobium macestii]|uniref:RNA binding protein YcfA (HicA-like mRNA interferase family) n=1 Tax=Desulfomicrobium macestii TaxID=90731 RepID=A0ABR9H8I2_9BACT|nr:type II toxin-antitoxin system HicA family toxin [Desulfomicrobium macestii]MBE1427002.1 putative RNA binding protein YcfA (HicA-like mRNA interferase family) [Desulfomicrobium macestii]
MAEDGKIKKCYDKLVRSPSNTSFEEFCACAESAGFIFKRQSGSHILYQHKDHPAEMMNFQNDKGKAKLYQVRQLIKFIEAYILTD